MNLRFSGDGVYLMPSHPAYSPVRTAKMLSRDLAGDGEKTMVYTHPQGSDLQGTYLLTGNAVDVLRAALHRLGFEKPKEHFNLAKQPRQVKIERERSVQYEVMGRPVFLTHKGAHKLINSLLLLGKKLESPKTDDPQEEWKKA